MYLNNNFQMLTFVVNYKLCTFMEYTNKINRNVSLKHSPFESKKSMVLPEYFSSFTLASSINMRFIEKIHTIISL